jgi:phosphoribosyl-dephospho-CoA transferase
VSAAKELLKRLIEIYHNHKLGRMVDAAAAADKGEALPRIVCSEGLL